MPLHLGRKPAVHTLSTMRSAIVMAHHLNRLSSPPTVSNDYVSKVDAVTGGNWGILGNDNYGCCVEADEGHYLMLRTANVGSIVIPTANDVLALYSAETGFNQNDPSTDQGTDETSDCQYMVSTGLLGHKADATGMVDPTVLDHVKWCIELFGACKFGVNLPQSAMDQFNAGQPWSVVADDGGILGGHDVPAVKYDSQFYVVTWGKLQPVEPDWVIKYTEEAHALVFADWVNAMGIAPSGLNMQELLDNLSKV